MSSSLMWAKKPSRLRHMFQCAQCFCENVLALYPGTPLIFAHEGLGMQKKIRHVTSLWASIGMSMEMPPFTLQCCYISLQLAVVNELYSILAKCSLLKVEGTQCTAHAQLSGCRVTFYCIPGLSKTRRPGVKAKITSGATEAKIDTWL